MFFLFFIFLLFNVFFTFDNVFQKNLDPTNIFIFVPLVIATLLHVLIRLRVTGQENKTDSLTLTGILGS